jgi:NAD(P)-dependent dehydrogenase (short-subunit alcohol dehydrogenase family)
VCNTQGSESTVSDLLTGKIVAISGAASGIGLATAVLAARYGAAGLVLVDRDADGLASAVEQATAAGCAAEPLTADLTADDAPEQIVGRAVDRFGRLDAAVNAAAIEGGATFLVDLTDANFDNVYDVNVRALFRCLRAQLRQMYAQGSGAIVNVSSASIFGVHPSLGAYVSSKAAVRTLSQIAAKEAGPRGVRVNAVCPGLTDTPMLRQSFGERPLTADIASRIPLGRVAEPGELAEAIVWLCSDRSSFTTGTSLVVDGGRVG